MVLCRGEKKPLRYQRSDRPFHGLSEDRLVMNLLPCLFSDSEAVSSLAMKWSLLSFLKRCSKGMGERKGDGNQIEQLARFGE